MPCHSIEFADLINRAIPVNHKVAGGSAIVAHEVLSRAQAVPACRVVLDDELRLTGLKPT
jgi:hypothetical protein